MEEAGAGVEGGGEKKGEGGPFEKHAAGGRRYTFVVCIHI